MISRNETETTTQVQQFRLKSNGKGELLMFVCDYTFAYSPTEVMRGGKLHWKRKLKNKFTSQRLLQKTENKKQEDSSRLQDSSIKQTCLRHE